MSHIVNVSASPACFDPLLPFKTSADKKVLDLYKKGAVLHVEQGGSFPDFWLSQSGLSDITMPNAAAGRALQKLGTSRGIEKVTESSGAGTVETWVFAPEKLTRLTSRWHRAQKCARGWSAHHGSQPIGISGLSDRALATLRYMKRQFAMVAHPELLDVWLELNSRGFIDVHANGGVHLRAEIKNMQVPWGAILRIKLVDYESAFVSTAKPLGTYLPMEFSVNHHPACPDVLSRFQNGKGTDILELFKAGAALHLSRETTPPTWRLEHRDGRTHYFEQDVGTAFALASFGRSTAVSGARITASRSAPSAGENPKNEAWEYDVVKLSTFVLEWESAQECAEIWNSTSGSFDKNTENLTELALATLRTLQQKYTLPLHDELSSVWRELHAKGYLEMFPEGYVQLAPAARDVAVAPGPRLALQYPVTALPPYSASTSDTGAAQ